MTHADHERGLLRELGPHNAEWLAQVHPPGWINPQPDGRYNMVVIGAGTGGLVTAAAVAGLGGRVALIEENLMGGDCLNFGCVPSKALLRSARAVADVRRASQFGVVVDGDVTVDFPAVMRRLRRIRSEISHHDSAERFSELGVDVFIGRGEFTGRDTIQVGEQTLKFARACVATGARAAVPPIEGLSEAPFLTNESLFDLTELPPRLAVVGGGVIGCEMAQAFARFGSQVALFEMDTRILPREEADAAAVVHEALAADGVDFHLNATVSKVDHQTTDGPFARIRLTDDDGQTSEVDALLIATGRRPNVTGMGLETAGVEYDERTGIVVDDRLKTTNSDVFAVGDVATEFQFTHAADFMARNVVRNALFFGRQKFSDLLIPRCTYTEPELAHVGPNPDELDVEYDTETRPFAEVDRSKLEGDTDGFVRFYLRAGSDEILGATIVGAHAGELISEVTVAMQAGMGLGDLADVIHPYPTRSEALRQAGDAFNRTRLTPTVSTFLEKVLSVRR